MKQATWISTTRQAPYQKAVLMSGNATRGSVLRTDGRMLQEIDGFGGCFNELGYQALQRAGQEGMNEVLRRLFSPDECHFTYCRLPIGANDFATSWYSLNETPGDYAMEHFTIARDRGCIIPYIQQAQRFSGPLTLFASPWSPPAWMKYPQVYNFGTLVWEDRNLQAYSLYFQKFVLAYAAEGIRIGQVHVQNEPVADQKFPSCVWTGAQMRDFIRDYLGPRFAQAGLDTQIWLGTLNCPFEDFGGPGWQQGQYSSFAYTVLSDEQAKSYLTGVGYQWGGKHAIQQTHAAYPDMKLIQTECECGDGKNSWEYAEYVFNLMWLYFMNGVSAFVYWNLALDADGVSTWGWRQNSLVSVTADGRVIYNPEYYLMRHFSQYVQPGARLLGLAGSFAGNALAFANPDGSVALQIHNPLSEQREVTFEHEGKCYTLAMPPHSFHTLEVK